MPVARQTIESVLGDGGFSQDGKRSSGLIDKENVSSSVNTELRYGRLLTGTVETETVDLVYETPSQIKELPGIPSIYFKYFDHQPSVDTVKKLRSSVWNQGRVPTLWIITNDTISIYDCFARPSSDETEDSHLLTKLTLLGENLKRLKEVEALHKSSFDSGAFWKSIYGQKIERNQRVDLSMLSDLSKTVEILTTPNLISNTSALKASIAHSLLGRAIFVSYLQDRSILDTSFFEEFYHCSSFKELLRDKDKTYSFFGWLRRTFNGNLFPVVSEEESTVSTQHLYVVQQFLSGTFMGSYPNLQQRLWPYQFNIIPIELISSIYEMFAHNLDPKAAEERSVHYTRLPLVELLLSLTMRDITHSARVLDPACGSGVFLVEAFRRLAWLKSKEYGRLLHREELHKLLCTQIFGMDIDLDAMNVTAFSLYLTLLELDPNPQPPSALKFPYLLPNLSLVDHVPNLYVQDFFNTEHVFNHSNPFKEGFDIIVGNPPWTALKKDTAPRDLETDRQWSLEYCIKNNVPDNKPDQAFMLRVRDFAKINTRIALIVCSRVFYQQEDRNWLDTFLSKNTFEVVVNFSDLVGENILFGGQSSTRLPASALLFRTSTPNIKNKITYISPKWYPNTSKQEEIIVTSEDVRSLSQDLLRQKPFLWKSSFRGVSRDYRLLNKLQGFPNLSMILSSANVKDLAHRGIIFGKGEQTDAAVLRGRPFLPSGLSSRYNIDINTLGPFDRPTIAKRRKPRYLELPALIISRALRNGRACIALTEASESKKTLVIDQAYYGIPFSSTHQDLVYRLNAVLNSKLAFYMAFMFSSALGWDRRLIEVGDWIQVRLPETILDKDNGLWMETIELEQWLRKNWEPKPSNSSAVEISNVEDDLDRVIYRLYDLSPQEIVQVEDTLRYNITPFLLRKERNYHFDELSEPTLDDLSAYARRMCQQLGGLLEYNNFGVISRVFTFEKKSPLCICQFSQKEMSGSISTLNTARVSGIEDVLDALSPLLRSQIADNLSIQRNLRIYDGEDFWIIKPSEKRLWSEAAALSDADAVVREHMEASSLG